MDLLKTLSNLYSGSDDLFFGVVTEQGIETIEAICVFKDGNEYFHANDLHFGLVDVVLVGYDSVFDYFADSVFFKPHADLEVLTFFRI